MNISKAKLAILISALCSPPLLAKPNILLIGTDGAAARYIDAGIRQTKPNSAIPDDSNEARALPTLQSMMREMGGALSLNTTSTIARNGRYNTVSGANWTSLLTGHEYDVHGVHSNSIVNTIRNGQAVQEFANFRGTPVLTQQLRAMDYKTKMMVEWNEIHLAYGRSFDEAERVPLVWRENLPGGTRGPLTPVTENNYRVGEALRQTDSNFVFVHIDNVDHEGHDYRWDSPDYARGMLQLDDKIKLILKGLMERPNINNEEWIIGLTPDHGGVGTGHGESQNPLVYNTYFLALHWNKGQWQTTRMRTDNGSTIADVLPRLMGVQGQIDNDVEIHVGSGEATRGGLAAMSTRGDSWVNPNTAGEVSHIVSQHALKKSGEGMLVINENTRFSRLEHQAGIIVFNAAHLFDSMKIAGGTLLNMGIISTGEIENEARLINNGSIVGNVTLKQGAQLGGDGFLVGNLRVNAGATVAPGNSIGTTAVNGDVTFSPGSTYEAEVARDGSSDLIASSGTITIDGAAIKVVIDETSNLLAQTTVNGLAGQRYAIISAGEFIDGDFKAITDNSLFLDASWSIADISWDTTDHVGFVQLHRNSNSFASIAATRNQKAVATAAEALGAGNPVYESLLMLGSADTARNALDQLNGQVYADVAATQINDSRYMRNALNNRLRQVEGLPSATETTSGNDKRLWGQFVGGWGNASGDGNAAGYRNSASGTLFGFDTDIAHGWRLGAATGFTRTSLDGDAKSNATSDNYHLGLYAGKHFGKLALRTGGAYAWHDIKTSRAIGYDLQAGAHAAKYHANTGQVFIEGAYAIAAGPANLEPFANLTHVSYQSRGLQENGGASALHADRQRLNATMFTTGLRAGSQWQIAPNTGLAVHTELGWIHNYGNTERNSKLMFRGSNQAFEVNGVAAARNGAILNTQAQILMGKNAVLSFGYSGQLSRSHRDNAMDAKLNWRF